MLSAIGSYLAAERLKMEVESSINSTQPIMNNQFAKQKTLINLGKGIAKSTAMKTIIKSSGFSNPMPAPKLVNEAQSR